MDPPLPPPGPQQWQILVIHRQNILSQKWSRICTHIVEEWQALIVHVRMCIAHFRADILKHFKMLSIALSLGLPKSHFYSKHGLLCCVWLLKHICGYWLDNGWRDSLFVFRVVVLILVQALSLPLSSCVFQILIGYSPAMSTRTVSLNIFLLFIGAYLDVDKVVHTQQDNNQQGITEMLPW